MTYITGFTKLSTIGGAFTVILNTVLEDLASFESLTSIGGDLFIQNNKALTSLNGLQNIDANTIQGEDGDEDLTIVNNSQLSECEVQSICDFLDLSGKTTEIYGNKSGCKNESDIVDACLAFNTFEDEWTNESVSIYPNPASNYFMIDFGANYVENAQISLLDISGNLLRSVSRNDQRSIIEVDISGINAGIYMLDIRMKNGSVYKKLVVE